MKITNITTYLVAPRWCFVEIETDAGITGWGEPVLEGKAKTVATCVEELKDLLIGEDPMRIEDLWQKMYRGGFYRGGGVVMSAISGIDQALWDIKGKFYNAPVYDLMGGACRDKMRVYAWIAGDRPDDVVSHALQRREEGFKSVKMNATEELQIVDSHAKIDKVLERVGAVREKMGRDFGIAIDFHGRVHKPMAKVLAKKLEEFDLMFIEEPILCDNMESFADVARVCNIPIATGERMFSRWEFKRLLQGGYVDIVQPDLSHAGGITEVKKIATMAEAYDVALAPHCPLGPIALACCLQIDASSYNAFIQEQSIGIHYNVTGGVLDYINNKEDFKFVDGFAKLPTLPGIGIDINKEVVLNAAKVSHNWKNPIWRHEDGSIAEW